MKNNLEIGSLLTAIQEASKDTIVFNEQAIQKEYQDKEYNQSSIAIKILTIVGSVVATLAFLGFLMLGGLYDSKIGLLTLGTLLIIGAIVLNNKSDKLILDTFSISAYALGFSLLMFGFGKTHTDDNLIALIFMLIALVTLYFSQNYMLSFLSVLVINLSMVSIIIFLNRTYQLAPIYAVFISLFLSGLYLFEAKIIHFHKKMTKLYRPVLTGTVVSYLVTLGYYATRKIHGFPIEKSWLLSTVLFIILLFVISKILNILSIHKQKQQIIAYLVIVPLLVITAFSPAILGALLLILLSFYVNHKIGLVLGILALLYFIGQYYYDLEFTLLKKSILLFASGMLFLILYLFTTKSFKNEKV